MSVATQRLATAAVYQRVSNAAGDSHAPAWQHAIALAPATQSHSVVRSRCTWPPTVDASREHTLGREASTVPQKTANGVRPYSSVTTTHVKNAGRRVGDYRPTTSSHTRTILSYGMFLRTDAPSVFHATAKRRHTDGERTGSASVTMSSEIAAKRLAQEVLPF